jgi:hypothetical protein
VWTDADLEALTAAERAELAQRLAALGDPILDLTPAVRRRRRRIFVDLLIVCCAVLIPWIAFLALTLPPRYVARHWSTAWVGLDVFLLLGLATTAWAGWRRRRIVVISSFMTATLLATDAWFDVLTDSTTGAFVVSLADALLVELPLAALLFWVGTTLLRFTTEETHRLAGVHQPGLAFWKVPLFALDEDPTRRTGEDPP